MCSMSAAVQRKGSSSCMPTFLSAASLTAMLGIAAFAAAAAGHTAGTWVLTGSVAALATAGAAVWLPTAIAASVLAVASFGALLVDLNRTIPVQIPVSSQPQRAVRFADLPDPSGLEATQPAPLSQQEVGTLLQFYCTPTWKALLAFTDSCGPERLRALNLLPLLAFTFDDWKKINPNEVQWINFANRCLVLWKDLPDHNQHLVAGLASLLDFPEASPLRIEAFFESNRHQIPAEALSVVSFASLQKGSAKAPLPSSYLQGVSNRLITRLGYGD